MKQDAVQVSKRSFSILEQRRQRGVPEMARSLFRMVYRKYYGTDPQDPQPTTMESLDSHPAAAIILLSILSKS